MAKPQPLIHAPFCYSIVEPGVYRCASPSASEVPFLASLGLRTIISLTPEHPTRQLVSYTRSAGIDFIQLGTTLFEPLGDWKPISDEIVKAALELILDRYELADASLGIHQTGIVFGCLRLMQGWNFASALSEYRAHSGPNKHRYADETYIELFDPDVINLPPLQCLPSWWDDGPVEEDEWVETDLKEKKKDKKDKKKDKENEEKKQEKTEKKGEKKEVKEERKLAIGEDEARISLGIDELVLDAGVR